MKRGWRTATLTLAGCAVALLCGCGGRANSITMAGSTAFQPFAEKLAEEFMAERPDVNVTVQGGGSAVGIQSALSGAAQIGMADLVELPPEARELTGVIVARDGIAMVVHPANPVGSVSTGQIRDIYNGTIRNWRELGGEDRPITVVSREAGSGTRSSFEEIVGGIKLSKDAIVQDSSGTIRETVANDANAVGYLSHGVLNDKIKPLQVDGLDCSEHNIQSGQYRLVRPVFLLHKGPLEGPAKDLIDFILSPQGQQTIATSGLLPAK